jgi:hypothetical protein
VDARYLFSSAGFQEIRLGLPTTGAICTMRIMRMWRVLKNVTFTNIFAKLRWSLFDTYLRYELSRVPFTSDEPVVGV